MSVTRRLKVNLEVDLDVPLTEVDHKFFKGQTIKTNGFNFIGCRFEDCILWVDKAFFIYDCCYFKNCVFLDEEPPKGPEN